MMREYKTYLLQVFDPSHGNYVVQMFGVAVATVSSFIMPVKSFLFLIGGLVVADLFTGWRKNRKLKGEALNSKGVGRTLEKTLLYLVLMLVSRGVDTNYGLDGTMSLSWFVSGLIVGREVLSIFENVDVALGTDFVPRIREVWQRIAGKHTPNA